MMLHLSTRGCISLNKFVGPLSSFSISRESHTSSPRIPSISLPSQPVEVGFPCTSAVSGVFNSRKSLFLGVRANQTMANQSAPPQSVHDFTVKDIKRNDVDLSIYKGKVLIIINVASECGLANTNYPELAELYGKYKDQGLEILAFPCNQFNSQEPGTNEEILEYACTRFKAEYPIFDKIDVNGETAAPLYKFLKSSKGSLLGDGIKWNFAKFLVDREGHVVDRYLPTTSPNSMEKDIKKLLEKA